MTKDREDRAYRAIGIPGQEVLDPQIDPFNNLFLDLAQACSVPRITPMETCHQADLGDREDIPRHASVQVDRWLREGKEQRITMPPMTKEGTGRRWLALRWPWLESATYRLRSAGMNRLVVEPDGLRVDDKDHVHTLFDFEFRRPCNLSLKSRLR
ncbi:uncharacterized protein APUU_50062A [Aspergillus puulaauensis]|uniref:Uncharacterized protein n=1 Tax=Aspergillus puulaauensis TaxID=1220207 RepID=A0A7R7XPI9_9EURO|nr:uncharacterized protein APUU_50062A [Aspergillus puulaauensis]BCS25351.1 hypothetical protein APUU_50062A [Aspergillus puulaauensis]